jgi:hypothetical protein
MTKYVYVIVAYDSWRDENVPRFVCAFHDKEAAEAFEREATGYTYQYGSRYNFPFDSPFDPGAKAQCVNRAPWYDIKEVELKGC